MSARIIRDGSRPYSESPGDGCSFEEVLSSTVGEFGLYQKVLLAASWAVTITLGINHYGYVVHSALPNHWCQVDELRDTSWTQDQIMEISIPKEGDKWSRCFFYQRNYTHLKQFSFLEAVTMVENVTAPTTSCSSWHYDNTFYSSTTTTEWNLVCSHEALRPTIQAVYLSGVLVGNLIMAPISDRLGRRVAVLLSLFLIIIGSFASALIPSYGLFLPLRFLAGIGVMGSYANTYILLLEFVGFSQRIAVTCFYDMGVSAGVIMLAGASYLMTDWRTLLLATAIGTLPLILYYWIIPESPRWLLLKRRQKEAEVILQKAIKWNKRDVSDAQLSSVLTIPVENTKKPRCGMGLFTLWLTPEMRSRSLKVHVTWLAIGAASFGSTYLIVGLPISPHFTMLLYSVQAIIIRLLLYRPISKLSRRKVFAASFIGLSLSLACSLFIPEELPWVGLATLMVSKMNISINFTVIYLFTGELFPTSVRSGAIGIGSVHARIGGIFAPYIVALLVPYHRAIPAAIFSALSACAAVMALLLPETRSENLPDTVADIEMWRQRKHKAEKEEPEELALSPQK